MMWLYDQIVCQSHELPMKKKVGIVVENRNIKIVALWYSCTCTLHVDT